MKKIIVLVMLCVAVLLTVAACGATLESVSVTKQPTKTTYRVGEEFDPAGGELTAKYSKGDDVVVSLDSAAVEIKGYNKSTSGVQTLTATYEGRSATFEVTVTKATAIEIVSQPRLKYKIGDTFDNSMGVLAVTNDYGSQSTIYFNDERVSFEGFSTTTAVVDKKVTVSFEGCSVDYYINVVHPSIEFVEVYKNPTKMDYVTGESFAPQGGQLRITYINDKIPSGMSEFVDIADADKIIYGTNNEFVTHNMDTLTSDITIQYGGFSTILTVNLTSEIESITINANPKSSYILKEPFYYGEGSIWVNYEDGQRKSVDLSDTRVEAVGFSSAALGTTTYKLVFEGAEITGLSATIVESSSDATALMAKYESLNNVSIDWVGILMGDELDVATNMTPSQMTTAIELLDEYELLESADRAIFSKYEARIVGLAFIAEFGEYLVESVAVSYAAFNTMTYSEAFAFEVSLPIFVAASEAKLERINTLLGRYSTVILYRQGGSTLRLNDLTFQIESAVDWAETLILGLEEIMPFFVGWDALPAETLPGYNFLQHSFIYDSFETITDFYDGLIADYVAEYGKQPSSEIIGEIVSYINQIIGIIQNWRPDYVDIIVEYLYQDGWDLETDSELLEMLNISFPAPLSDAMLYMSYYYSYYDTFAGYMLQVPLFMYFNGARDAVEYLYASGYESSIYVYENWLLGFMNENEQYRTMQMYYDFMRGNDRSLMGMYLPNEYYVPSGDVKDFLDTFYPVMMDGFWIVFAGYSYDVVLDPYVEAIREQFYNLSSQDKLLVYFIFCDHEMANAYHGLVSLYMNSKLKTNELAVYYAFAEMEYNYFLYVNQPDEQYSRNLRTSYDNFRALYNALGDKTTLRSIMSHELEFYASMSTWIRYLDDEYSFNSVKDDMMEVLTLAMQIISSGGAYSIDQAVYLYYELETLITANPVAWEQLSTVAFSYPDGQTAGDYYDIIKEVYEANYGKVVSSTNQDIKDFFDYYINDFIGVFLSGNAYNTAQLKENFYELGADATFFMAYGQDNNAGLIIQLINDYMRTIITDNEGRQVYGVLLEAIDSVFLFEIRQVSPEYVLDRVKAYEDIYKEYEELLAGRENGADVLANYDAAVVADLAFLDELLNNGFLKTYVELDGQHKLISRYLTDAIMWLNTYDNIPMFTIYLNAAVEAYDNLGVDSRNILKTKEVFELDGTTVGDLIDALVDQRDFLLLTNLSDDDQTVALYESLLEMGFNYYEVDGYRTGLQFKTDILNLYAGVQALSVFQQGVFMFMQAGTTPDGYFGLFETVFFEYLKNEIYPQKDDESKEIELLTLAYGAMGDYINLYYYINSSPFDNIFDAKAILTSTDAPLTQASIDAFNNNAIIKEIYDNALAHYLNYENLSVYSANDYEWSLLGGALSNMYKTVESYIMMQLTGDSTYFHVFYGLLTRGIANMPSGAVTPFLALKIEGARYGSEMNGKTFAQIIQLFETVTKPVGLDNVFSRYLYYADKFIDCWGGLDIMGYMVDFYDGDTAEDIAVIIEYVEALSDSDKAAFLAEADLIYRSMLKYYHYTQNPETLLTWYNTYKNPTP